ncbi:hypothetical protein [Gimesia algae]|uniref:Uncharacterized protein n=1 Tax=Gimesia algae TaxID=2527971 RepID=A0A517VKG4_9PLAN|nr:hypothetical protein [Gimesia algae]QDT93509.1 hypothetical protein Pan161_51890 [Gimesia algae]
MGKRPKKLMYAGGGILALGIILGQYFGLTPGINSGSGEAEKTADPAEEESRAIMASSESEIIPILIQPEPKQEKSLAELPVKVLDILIDDRNYLVKAASQSKDKYRPAEMNEILTLAKQASGDADGIHVRVYRTGSARVVPEDRLKEELGNSGLQPHMIDWKIHLID